MHPLQRSDDIESKIETKFYVFELNESEILFSLKKQSQNPNCISSIQIFIFNLEKLKNISFLTTCILKWPLKTEFSHEIKLMDFKLEVTYYCFNNPKINDCIKDDILIGFNSGDIIKYNFNSLESKQYNENGSMIGGKVKKLIWISNFEFLAIFCDSFVYIFNIDYEDDPNFNDLLTDPRIQTKNENQFNSSGWISPTIWRRYKIEEQNPKKKLNPVIIWSIFENNILDLQFSNDFSMFASTSSQGQLKIFNSLTLNQINSFKSYYGIFTCFDWSPDNMFIITGGQDDIVSLWSTFSKFGPLLRNRSHSAWISKVKFNPFESLDGFYNFASISQDCRLAFFKVSKKNINILKNQISIIEEKEFLPIDESIFVEPIFLKKVTSSPCSDLLFLTSKTIVVGSLAGQIAFIQNKIING